MAARRRGGGRGRRRRPPEGVFRADVDDLAHDGRGVARPDAKVTFIHGALPQETVEFRYDATHSQYDEARVEQVLTASPDRVEPRCAHFGLCGGCALQHLHPDRQIDYKQSWLQENFRRIGNVSPERMLAPLRGPAYQYRYKARLGVKYVDAKQRVLVGFRERETPFIADLRRCEVLHPALGGLLDELAELVGGLTIYRRLPQIEVAFGDECGALVFRVLDPPDDDDRAALAAFGARHGLQIYLQPKGPASVVALRPDGRDDNVGADDNDNVNGGGPAPLSYRLPEHDLTLRFLPQHFTQVNPAINRQMVDQALRLLAPAAADEVLDLYCGLGNFTLALARAAARVTGVEGDAAMVDWAGRNAAANGIDNARFYSADLSVLPEQPPPWMTQRYDKVLLDPPRSGAEAMMPLIGRLQPQRVVYVSCHPATLARDAGVLVNEFGYRLGSAGVMDMFPHTAHVESIALFQRKNQ